MELFAADGHDAGGCERVTGKSGMRPLRQRIGAVMKWAVAQGYRTDNPTGDAISAALPKRTNPARHMPALRHGEVAGAIEAVNASSAWVGTKLCFEFMVLTAARPGEARGARWEEIDFSALVWTIPATRMKASREHRVPLCARAVEILHAAARPLRGSTTAQPGGLVFPSARGEQLADARLSKLLEQLGIGAVPHGFRSSFPGLGVRADQSPARGGRGRARARGAQPDRSGVCEERPVRPSAATHDRLDAVPRAGTLTPGLSLRDVRRADTYALFLGGHHGALSLPIGGAGRRGRSGSRT